VLIGLLETPQLSQLLIGGASSIQYMTLRTIPPWSSPLIEQACKRSKKRLSIFKISHLVNSTNSFIQQIHHMPGTSSRRRAVREHMKELHFSDLSPGLARVSRVMGRPAGSTGFCRVIVLAGLLLNPNRSSHRVDRVPGRPAGPGPV